MLIIGAAAFAVVTGASLALLANSGTRQPREAERSEPRERTGEGVQPVSSEAVPTFNPAAAREPYRPVDREAIGRAYGQVGAVYAAEGVSGLARFGIECFRSLEQAPNYSTLDYCLAFDAIAAAVNQRLSGPAAPPANSWFGQAPDRDLKVAQAVMGAEGDAAARLIDIRRLAVEVARQGGPVVQASAPAAAAPADPAPVPAAAATPAAAPAPAPARVATAPAPAPRPAQEPARAAAPRPTRQASVAEPREAAPAPARSPARAATASAGARPSFNCRYARTRSERLICGDPGLAALDRGLNAAYEEAIAAGADRRTLRAAQDRWLSVREAAAGDPDAVADVYRRRIDELRGTR
jgi:hypothetical protein